MSSDTTDSSWHAESRASCEAGAEPKQGRKVCKTVRQYSRGPVSEEIMEKLGEIAKDYRKVKNYVYDRYGGIASLPKLYPGYTVQNEMTRSGLRTAMEMPSVYFYLAVFDALGDIKGQWTRTKSKVLELVGRNETFSPEEKHYLRFLIKVDSAFDAVINQKEVKLPDSIQKKYQELAGPVDREKLHRYLCRQVRKYHTRQHTDQALGFSVSERAYRYKDHGIYISVKEKRKRVFIPLTDSNQYGCQLYIRLFPERKSIEICVPVNVKVRSHEDYNSQTGISMGLYTMLTTDRGVCYGEELGRYQTEYAEWIRRQTGIYNRNRADNPGRKKYNARKKRLTDQMHGYINQELNRFLLTEKPRSVYVAKLPKPGGGGVNRKVNNSMTMWHRGYIRDRLAQKCREQSVELVEVLGKDISIQCSVCGENGTRKEGFFTCGVCGYREEEKTNTARNALRRGLEGKTVRS